MASQSKMRHRWYIHVLIMLVLILGSVLTLFCLLYIEYCYKWQAKISRKRTRENPASHQQKRVKVANNIFIITIRMCAVFTM